MARSHLFTLSAVLALTSAAGAQTPFGDVAGLTTALPCIDSLVTADFDGDGDQDILVGSVIGTQLRWCENLGSGELANPQLLAGTAAAYSIDAADLDGDGLPEAIAVDRNSGSLLWFRNLGGGAFAQFQFASTSVPGARWVEAADIDGDGDMDLVAAAEFGNSVVWVENLGGGAFGLTREVDNSASRPLSLGTGDFDGDGDLDVAALLAGTDVVVWYENRGGGSFGPQNLIAPFPMVRAEMEVADYDGDGALDVLFTADDCFVRGCAGSGLGSFAAPVALTTTNLCAGPTDLDLGDHDLDGDADLLTTNFGVTVSWTEQLSPGQFAPTAGVQFGFFQCAVSKRLPVDSADMDGDGDLDLVTFVQPNRLHWYENETITYEDCNGNDVHDPLELASNPALDVDGNGVLDDCEQIGSRFCSPAIRNSTGAAGELLALGSPDVAANDVTLIVRSLPAQAPGYFLTSLTPGFTFPVNNSQGALCVTGAVGRFIGPGQVLRTDALGTAVLGIDLGALPTPMGPVSAAPMQTWHFTFWHRDTNPTSTSNFTDAVSLTFL